VFSSPKPRAAAVFTLHSLFFWLLLSSDFVFSIFLHKPLAQSPVDDCVTPFSLLNLVHSFCIPLAKRMIFPIFPSPFCTKFARRFTIPPVCPTIHLKNVKAPNSPIVLPVPTPLPEVFHTILSAVFFIPPWIFVFNSGLCSRPPQREGQPSPPVYPP